MVVATVRNLGSMVNDSEPLQSTRAKVLQNRAFYDRRTLKAYISIPNKNALVGEQNHSNVFVRRLRTACQ